MLGAERIEYLTARLTADGTLVAKDVATDLGISEDSVRRDLREMAARGLCQRVYGGAVPVSPAVADYDTRTSVEPASKQRVAARAARLIRPDSTVILDGGTTTLAVAAALPADLACTVVTHSPTVAAALVSHPRVEVLLIGGRLFKHSAVACGAAAAEAASAVSADLFLLGVTGVHATEGLTTGDSDEAAMKRLLASRAADTYVLASREKIGVASRHRVLPLGGVTGIVTDVSATDETLTAVAAAGVEVVDATKAQRSQR
jgi:DeoR/GlpR family transcriptional regulator of sugar metabolism